MKYEDGLNGNRSKKEVHFQIEEGIDDWFSRDEKVEELPEGIHTTEDILKELAKENLTPSDVYRWYSEVMERRNREPLPEDNFIEHFFGEYSTGKAVAFGDATRGYLLGFLRHDVFTPSHFAPRTLRKAYDLFSDLGKSREVASVLVITPDLADTLSKMPSWHELPDTIGGFFRGVHVEKKIMYNSHPDVVNKMKVLYEEILDNASKSNK